MEKLKFLKRLVKMEKMCIINITKMLQTTNKNVTTLKFDLKKGDVL
ncbi:hypothetical protein [Niameybacter massiliensis]|nr:hypothetical protein [Niameybacter massiliensis]